LRCFVLIFLEIFLSFRPRLALIAIPRPSIPPPWLPLPPLPRRHRLRISPQAFRDSPVFLPPTRIASYTLQAPSRSEVAWAGMLAGGLERKGAITSAFPSRRGAWDAVVSKGLEKPIWKPCACTQASSCACSATMAESEKARLRKGSGFLYAPHQRTSTRPSKPSGTGTFSSPSSTVSLVAYVRYHQYQSGTVHYDTIAPQPRSDSLAPPSCMRQEGLWALQ
jgi:hypothetical protein